MHEAPFELLPYQKVCVHDVSDFDGIALLALDPGLGKTIISLEWLLQNPQALPAIVVCPASVKFTWQHEAMHYAGMHSFVCEGRVPPKRGSDFDLQSPLTIINYDISPYWVSYLKRIGFKTIIIDECQNIQNPKTKRTKAVREIARGRRYKLAPSATPLLNRPSELWPILNILWPKMFPSFWSYAQEYCDPKYTHWGWDYTGSSNLDVLHHRLARLGMIRYRKADVLSDLPPKVRRVVPCKMQHMDTYYEIFNDFIRYLSKNEGHRVRAASKAEELTKQTFLLQFIAKHKMKSVVAWANRFLEETDEKLILAAIHTKAINLLCKRVNAGCVKIDGSVPSRKRSIALDQFQNDKRIRVMVCQMNSVTGNTMTAASEMGIVELPWRPGDLDQIEGRAHRIGQDNTVFINYLIATGTLEEKLCNIIQSKEGVLSAVLDGGATAHDINLYNELLECMRSEL